MRSPLMPALVLGLLAGPVLAQRTTTTTTVVTTRDTAASPKLLDLSRQLATGAEALRAQVERGEPQSGKLEKRILNNLLGGGDRSRDGRDPIYRELDVSAHDLTSAADDLSRRSRRGAAIEDERQFIRRFRNVERLAADIDRNLSAPTARGIFVNQVQPGVAAIRAELPTLAAYQERQDRQERREDRRETRRDRN